MESPSCDICHQHYYFMTALEHLCKGKNCEMLLVSSVEYLLAVAQWLDKP